MKVSFSYLARQFADVDAYLADVREQVLRGDFTLGKAVTEFEQRFAALCRMPHAIGVGSGTDALILSLKMLGVGPGDEVITAANTFIATVGAIAMTGAKPVFVDSDVGYTIDPGLIDAAITPKTKAIVPVHYTGNVANMPAIMKIAERHRLVVVEDACQSISGEYDSKPVGSWGETACFSLHPLKNLNVWGDAGVIVCRSDELNRRLRLFRNHGLTNRNEVEFFGHNSRLDSLQAVVGNRLIAQTQFITSQKIANAKRLDEGLADLAEFVEIPPRPANVKHVYHLYIIRVKRRDELLAYLKTNEIDARVHYPIPVHLQRAASDLGYVKGDFPVAERDSEVSITLPAHQHLSDAEIEYMLEKIHAFMGVEGESRVRVDSEAPGIPELGDRMPASGFLTPEEVALGNRFLGAGYVVQPVEDTAALDRIRSHAAGIAAERLGLPAPFDAGSFLNRIGEHTDAAQLNDLRLAVFDGLNAQPWFRQSYFALARTVLGAIVGNELVMQRRINLSIQLPDDDSSLLPVHADVWSGDSPFEVVVWLPLVDCYRTKAMYLTPPGKDREVQTALRAFNGRSSEDLYHAIAPFVDFIEISYGQVMVFNHNLMHGNRINTETEARWSMNCRFKSVFSPYADKKLGEFFEPITLRPATRFAMSHTLPGGFEE